MTKIEDIQKAIAASAGLAISIEETIHYGGTLWRLRNIYRSLKAIKKANLREAHEHYKALDPSQKYEVLAYAKEVFDLENDRIEEVVETSIALYQNIKKVRAIINEGRVKKQLNADK